MKRLIAAVLVLLMLIASASCSSSGSNGAVSNSSQNTASRLKNAEKKLDKILNQNNFRGIVYITRKGKPVYSFVKGKDEKGNPLNINTTMYMGSISKQFCATAVIILRDKGKLNVSDTIDKYFPEYKNGKKITIKNLLTMRSGLPREINGNNNLISPKYSEKKNIEGLKKAIFATPLQSKPDTEYEYSNSNFFLLALIVEQVSKQHYSAFIRENIFKPLKMTHSGFVDEVRNHPNWAKAITYDTFTENEISLGLTKGAGDIASNSKDMDAWMTALSGGKIVSKKSFKEMTKDYSPDYASRYGYGLERGFKDGVCHSGHIGNYLAKDYMHTESGYNVFIATKSSCPQLDNFPKMLLEDFI